MNHNQNAYRKRKRERESDSDTGESYGGYGGGSQVLPVASSLPLDGIPTDGAEYLYSVRLNASLLPLTSRVPPPEVQDVSAPPPEAVSAPAQQCGRHPKLPSDEWKSSFVSHFTQFRENVRSVNVSSERVAEARRTQLPGAKDRPGWYRFLHPNLPDPTISRSRPSIPNPPISNSSRDPPTFDIINIDDASSDEEDRGEVPTVLMTGFVGDDAVTENDLVEPEPTSYSPTSVENFVVPAISESAPKPTIALLRRLDQETIQLLIMHYYHWLAASLDATYPPKYDADGEGEGEENGRSKDEYTVDPVIALSASDAQWLFSLLAHFDNVMSTAKDISLLRNLARVCVSLIRRSLDHDRTLNGNNSVANTNTKNTADVLGVDGGDERPLVSRTSDQTTGRTSCWMIVAAIVSLWGQNDLWLEASARLYGSHHHEESVDTTNYSL